MPPPIAKPRYQDPRYQAQQQRRNQAQLLSQQRSGGGNYTGPNSASAKDPTGASGSTKYHLAERPGLKNRGASVQGGLGNHNCMNNPAGLSNLVSEKNPPLNADGTSLGNGNSGSGHGSSGNGPHGLLASNTAVSGAQSGQIGQGNTPNGSSNGTNDISNGNSVLAKELAKELSMALPQPPKNDSIIIYVYDETTGLNKNFTCSQKVLLEHMKYFESYLSDVSGIEDVEISVHCDIGVFTWLVEYMNHSERQIQKISTNNVISILISAEFLQMSKLVDLCLKYVKPNMNKVLLLPIDLTCLNAKILDKFSSFFTEEEVESIEDPEDKLQSRLFERLLNKLLKENDIKRCVYCGELFTPQLRTCTDCDKAEVFIDYYGRTVTQHVALPDWSIERTISEIMSDIIAHRAEKKKRDEEKKKESESGSGANPSGSAPNPSISLNEDLWDGAKQDGEEKFLQVRDVFWQLWGRIHVLPCTTCNSNFFFNDYVECKYHPEPAVFSNSANYYEASDSGNGSIPVEKNGGPTIGGGHNDTSSTSVPSGSSDTATIEGTPQSLSGNEAGDSLSATRGTSSSSSTGTVAKRNPNKGPFPVSLSHAAGIYRCCGHNILRFDPAQRKSGCERKNHTVDVGQIDCDKLRRAYRILIKNEEVICGKSLFEAIMRKDRKVSNLSSDDDEGEESTTIGMNPIGREPISSNAIGTNTVNRNDPSGINGGINSGGMNGAMNALQQLQANATPGSTLGSAHLLGTTKSDRKSTRPSVGNSSSGGGNSSSGGGQSTGPIRNFLPGTGPGTTSGPTTYKDLTLANLTNRTQIASLCGRESSSDSSNGGSDSSSDDNVEYCSYQVDGKIEKSKSVSFDEYTFCSIMGGLEVYYPLVSIDQAYCFQPLPEYAPNTYKKKYITIRTAVGRRQKREVPQSGPSSFMGSSGKGGGIIGRGSSIGFFDLKFPGNARRQRDQRLDMIREDDKRRSFDMIQRMRNKYNKIGADDEEQLAERRERERVYHGHDRHDVVDRSNFDGRRGLDRSNFDRGDQSTTDHGNNNATNNLTKIIAENTTRSSGLSSYGMHDKNTSSLYGNTSGSGYGPSGSQSNMSGNTGNAGSGNNNSSQNLNSRSGQIHSSTRASGGVTQSSTTSLNSLEPYQGGLINMSYRNFRDLGNKASSKDKRKRSSLVTSTTMSVKKSRMEEARTIANSRGGLAAKEGTSAAKDSSGNGTGNLDGTQKHDSSNPNSNPQTDTSRPTSGQQDGGGSAGGNNPDSAPKS